MSKDVHFLFLFCCCFPNNINTMKPEKGIYIRLVKGFKFTEPVFYPESLKGNLRFLSNSQDMKKKISLMGKSKYAWEVIKNYGCLKPIRNPWIKYDQFWEPFQHSELPKTKESGFRMYPFQIIPSPSEQIETHIQKKLFENIFNIKFQSFYSQYQIRLYPSGAGTVHLIIHLKLPPVTNINNILNIILKGKWINSPFLLMSSSSMNFFGWAENIYNGVLKQISEHREEKNEIPGYITLINLQGDFSTTKIRKTLENFQAKKKRNSIFLEKDKDDIIYLYKNLLFLYIDSALPKFREWRYLKRPNFILHGRRCFRGQLLNIAELGYCSAYLLRFYNNVAQGLFGEPRDLKWISTLEKIVYIPSYLKREQWKKAYACELCRQGINEDFIDTLRNSLEKLKSSSSQPQLEKILSKLMPLSELILVALKMYGLSKWG